jgi:small subunit ribosomal protein S15
MSLDTNKKAKVMKDFGISANDTGSMQVQIALLTERIKEISSHREKNPKDNSSKRGLLQAVAQRRNYLEYLKKHDLKQYKTIVSRLELRK